MTTTAWRERPSDVASLFNPAFCALLINRVCTGFSGKEPNAGLPYALAFIALPILFHSPTVDTLPAKASAKFHLWLMNNQSVLVDLADRARALSPFVREGIAFGLKSEVISLSQDAKIVGARISPARLKKWESRHGINLAYQRAELFGKLLRQVGNVSTIFALFGVRP